MTQQLSLQGIAVYNPGIHSRDEIKRYFVVRQPLLNKLLDALSRETPGSISQHRLIAGTRGMGKTMLLHRLALAVTEDVKLSQTWLALNFPEEQYNIAHLSDLWVNCLDALGDALEVMGKAQLLAELDHCVDQLPDQEEQRAQAALQALLGFAQQLDKRLLLLIDNLDSVFARLTDSHWAIREVLGNEPRILLIGASAYVLEETFKYEAAFYEFFKIHELKGLSETEMREMLSRLAEVGNNQDIQHILEQQPTRLRTLHTLTGGNPRTTVLLYGVLAQGIEGDVRSDLERLLDHCTPLYKARFEELAPQAQKVVDAMAVYWDPLSAARLAKQTRLPVNTVSTQLTRLQQQGVVEKVTLKPGRKNGFQIAERFFNIWYLMRTSRRVRRRLVWLVQFLKVFYSQEELQKYAHRYLQTPNVGNQIQSLRHAEYTFNLAQAIAKQLEVKPDESAWCNLGIALGQQGDLEGAIEVYHKGMQLPETRGECHNHLAWLYFIQQQNLAEAEALSREAVRLDPGNVNRRHTLAMMLVSNNNWPEAEREAKAFLQLGDENWLDQTWDELVLFFREAVAKGYAAEAIALLQETGVGERIRPLYIALNAIAEGPDSLSQVAPEIRQPAQVLIKQLTTQINKTQ